MLEITLTDQGFNTTTDIPQTYQMSSRTIPPSILSAAAVAHGDGPSDVPCRCKLCDVSGCDVRILHCGCALHAVSD